MIKLKLALAVCGLLALVIGQNLQVVAQQPQPQPAPQAQPQPAPQVQYAAVLTVKHMCCGKESIPAIKGLSVIPGVKRVSVNYQTRSLYIEKTDVVPSPQALWDAAARIQIEPLRLATPEGVYTARPLR